MRAEKLKLVPAFFLPPQWGSQDVCGNHPCSQWNSGEPFVYQYDSVTFLLCLTGMALKSAQFLLLILQICRH